MTRSCRLPSHHSFSITQARISAWTQESPTHATITVLRSKVGNWLLAEQRASTSGLGRHRYSSRCPRVALSPSFLRRSLGLCSKICAAQTDEGTVRAVELHRRHDAMSCMRTLRHALVPVSIVPTLTMRLYVSNPNPHAMSPGTNPIRVTVKLVKVRDLRPRASVEWLRYNVSRDKLDDRARC